LAFDLALPVPKQETARFMIDVPKAIHISHISGSDDSRGVPGVSEVVSIAPDVHISLSMDNGETVTFRFLGESKRR
jgi:hypothetical protein